MQASRYLIVVAGGSGTRMGTSVPKQFLPLGGKAVLQISIEKFLDAFDGDIRVVTVLPEDHIRAWKDYCYENTFTCRQSLVCGGFTRFHSVRNALEKVPRGCLVAVHDAVRPMVTQELIRELFDAAGTYGAAVPAIPCADTVRCLSADDSGLLVPIPDRELVRSELFAVQTPQVFSSDLLKDAYSLPYDTGFTDDASVVQTYLRRKNDTPAGEQVHKVVYIKGDRLNFKLTTPDDLAIAKLLTEK